MEPASALALLIGALAVVHTSDTVSAVLLGAPGSASASVTMLDGYAMARKGQAKRALSLAFLSSMAGGIIGAIGLTLAIPLVLSFASPELFMLTVLGVALAAVLSRGNVIKGLTAGLLADRGSCQAQNHHHLHHRVLRIDAGPSVPATD